MSYTFKFSDPQAGQAVQYQAAPICGFWRRLIALLLDGVILAVAGCILGLIFGRYFVRMGPYGRIVGFIITLLYFGLQNSSAGKGQSIGKRALKIKVVDQTGNSISWRKSFLRTFILIIPFYLNGLNLPAASIGIGMVSLLVC
mgnify:CR=1 FL=1